MNDNPNDIPDYHQMNYNHPERHSKMNLSSYCNSSKPALTTPQFDKEYQDKFHHQPEYDVSDITIQSHHTNVSVSNSSKSKRVLDNE